MVTTLQPNAQSRALIVKTVLAGGTQITWQLAGGSGFQFDGTQLSAFGPSIAQTATSGYLVLGNSGIAATKGILTDTTNNQLSDDFVTAELLAANPPPNSLAVQSRP